MRCKVSSVKGDRMIWANPQDLILYPRSSYYYNMFIIYLFFLNYFDFINCFGL